MFSAAILTCTVLLAPQEPAPAASSDPLAKFEALPENQRRTIMRGLERQILLDPDPAIQNIVSLARNFNDYPDATPRTFHDPKKWARRVAPNRVLVRQGTDKHRAVRNAIPTVPFLTELHCAVRYDWGTGQVVRRAQPLNDVEVFDNLLHGYPPGSDAAVAHVLATLDNVPEHRPMAAYLEHLYADLKARAYEDITLYEAWYTGEVLDVPDVDSIPFAVQILKTRSFRSPIPRGRKRTDLYQKIREHTLKFRLYRTLREAAAAGYVRAEPVLDPKYQLLVPRFHYLWAAEREDAERVAAWLEKLPDRAALLTEIDQTFKSDPKAFELREGRKEQTAAMAAKVRGLAMASL